MSNPSENETEITLVAADGRVVSYSPQSFIDLLKADMRAQSVTVSVKEGRQRAQFQGSERFTSMNIDLSNDWKLLDQVPAEGKQDAVKLFGEALTQKIMDAEGYLYNRVVHMQAKDGLPCYARDKTNQFVANPYDLRAAVTAAGGQLP